MPQDSLTGDATKNLYAFFLSLCLSLFLYLSLTLTQYLYTFSLTSDATKNLYAFLPLSPSLSLSDLFFNQEFKFFSLLLCINGSFRPCLLIYFLILIMFLLKIILLILPIILQKIR